jgi:hypothetical protein
MGDDTEKVSGRAPSPTEKKKREYKDFGHETEGPTSSYIYFLGFRRH